MVDKSLVYRLFFLFAFSFLVFSGVFLRPDLFGQDTYAVWECVEGNCFFLANQPAAIFLFQLMPSSLLFFKFVMFFCFFLSVLALFYIVEWFFDERTAWLSIFVGVATVPLWLFTFAQFENDIFALPLIFWGFYCFFRKEYLFGVGCWVLSLFFWLWLGYLGVVPGYGVLEGQLFSGLLPLFFGLLYLLVFFSIKDKKLKLFCIPFLIFGLWSGKITILLMPFIMLGIGQLVNLVREKDNIKNMLYAIAFFMIIGLNIAILLQSPTVNEWKSIDLAIQTAKDENLMIYNDWSFGYWLIHKDYNALYRGGGRNPSYSKLEKPFLALTQENLDCNLMIGFYSLARNIKLYKC